ncbi:abasic site processing protein HMCES [Engraulis encrasicolus]|uniref:abasic site processing protein HMCES n=1 Tax=Engraulis encrasicolus TaxID=184585 RepID=UPI002FD1B196
MCGRTACTLAPDEVSRASKYRDRSGRQRRPQWRDGDMDKYRPSYNKSPQSNSPVLLSHRHFKKDAPVDEFVLAAMRWGLVPAWFKEDDPSKMQYSTNNCRREGLMEKKTYKDPLLKGQRCVILADGFYEWRRQDKDKQPFFIYFPQSKQTLPGSADTQCNDNVKQEECPPEEETAEQEEGKDEGEESSWTGWRLLTMAGLFDCWTPPSGGEPVYTYTVITVDASSDLQGIHDRMPAVLDGEEEVRRWLDFGEVRSLQALELLSPKNVLKFHPVSSFVNNSRNNSPECLQPVDPNIKKKPVETASSKMMMSWLKSSTPAKRKEAEDSSTDTAEENKAPAPKQPKTTTGPMQQWLLGKGTNKK